MITKIKLTNFKNFRQAEARLHESSWMENTMEFSEGTPKPFPLEETVP